MSYDPDFDDYYFDAEYEAKIEREFQQYLEDRRLDAFLADMEKARIEDERDAIMADFKDDLLFDYWEAKASGFKIRAQRAPDLPKPLAPIYIRSLSPL